MHLTDLLLLTSITYVIHYGYINKGTSPPLDHCFAQPIPKQFLSMLSLLLAPPMFNLVLHRSAPSWRLAVSIGSRGHHAPLWLWLCQIANLNRHSRLTLYICRLHLLHPTVNRHAVEYWILFLSWIVAQTLVTFYVQHGPENIPSGFLADFFFFFFSF